MYFVYTFGNLEKDPLDYHVSIWNDLNQALQCVKTCKNKGYSVLLYEGKEMSIEKNLEDVENE